MKFQVFYQVCCLAFMLALNVYTFLILPAGDTDVAAASDAIDPNFVLYSTPIGSLNAFSGVSALPQTFKPQAPTANTNQSSHKLSDADARKPRQKLTASRAQMRLDSSKVKSFFTESELERNACSSYQQLADK